MKIAAVVEPRLAPLACLNPVPAAPAFRAAAPLAQSQWTAFYKLTRHAGPRRLLLEALQHAGDRVERPGLALDLGCGAGGATRVLHERTRWQVRAVDHDPASAQFLAESFPAGLPARVQFDHACATGVEVPAGSAELIWAGLSLPYVPPLEIAPLWEHLVAGLASGGLFAGDLFGPEHGHRGRDDMNFHTPAQVERMVDGLEVLKLERIQRMNPFSNGRQMVMDCYHIIARKP